MSLLRDVVRRFVDGGPPAPPAMEVDGVCECCWRLEGDGRAQPVAYCALCDAYLCARCRGDWWRRVRAALA